MDAPRAGPREVQVKVSVCAVCRTDLHLIEGDLEAHGMPVISGHQIVGRVDETAEGVKRACGSGGGSVSHGYSMWTGPPILPARTREPVPRAPVDGSPFSGDPILTRRLPTRSSRLRIENDKFPETSRDIPLTLFPGNGARCYYGCYYPARVIILSRSGSITWTRGDSDYLFASGKDEIRALCEALIAAEV
jgi:Alcohol dehydrogenase GroES-like domain